MDLRRLIIYLIGCIYAAQILWELFSKLITNPITFFRQNNRTNPPCCLSNSKKWKHKYARLKNVYLHYVVAGSESKPLMIMLHGFPEFWYSWRFQIPKFSDEFRVVALDLRGYGDSEKPKDISDYGIDHLVGDIKEMIKYLGYSSAVVVGHDLGGAIAWNLAIHHPEMVDRLIVMNTPHPLISKKHLRKRKLFKSHFHKSWLLYFFQIPYLPEIYLRYNDYEQIGFLFTLKPWGGAQKGSYTKDDIDAYKYNAASEGTLTAAVNYFRASLARNKGAITTKKLKMPVCLICGTNDEMLDTEMAKMSVDYCKDFTIKVIEGGGHRLNQEAPNDVTNCMKIFLDLKSEKNEIFETKTETFLENAIIPAYAGMNLARTYKYTEMYYIPYF